MHMLYHLQQNLTSCWGSIRIHLELNQNSLRVDLYCILQKEEALPGAVPISQTLGCSTSYALHQAERGECSQGDVWVGWLSWSLSAKCCADINLYCQGACSCCPDPQQLLCSANTKLRSQFLKSSQVSLYAQSEWIILFFVIQKENWWKKQGYSLLA